MAAAGWTARRHGAVMYPDPADPHEAWGVQPGAARGPDGELYLSPAWSPRATTAWGWPVRFEAMPVGVERLGVALEPEEQWERHCGGGGV